MNCMILLEFPMEYYVKIFDSPRSSILPKAYSARSINLIRENQSLFAIYKVRNFRCIWTKLRHVRFADAWIEYSGNPFSNIIILLILLFHRNSITLDCHNSAIEYTTGKPLRHRISLCYLKLVELFFKIKIVVHNDAVKKKLSELL